MRVAASPSWISRGSSFRRQREIADGAAESGRRRRQRPHLDRLRRRPQPDRLGAGERRAEGEEGAVVALHHQVDRRRLQLEGARPQGEQRLLEQRHPAVAPAVDVHHVGRELLGERDVAHPEAAEGRDPVGRDAGDVLARIEIDRVEHLLADHRPRRLQLGAEEDLRLPRLLPPGARHAAEEPLEGVVLRVRGARAALRLEGGLLLHPQLLRRQAHLLVVEPDDDRPHPRLAERQRADLPGGSEGARQVAVGEADVVESRRAAQDLQVVQLEVRPEAHAGEALAMDLDGERRRLVEADHLRLEGDLDLLGHRWEGEEHYQKQQTLAPHQSFPFADRWRARFAAWSRRCWRSMFSTAESTEAASRPFMSGWLRN